MGHKSKMSLNFQDTFDALNSKLMIENEDNREKNLAFFVKSVIHRFSSVPLLNPGRVGVFVKIEGMTVTLLE